MKRPRTAFAVGLALGVILGSAGGAIAAAKLSGYGVLKGWRVTDTSGRVICYEPTAMDVIDQIVCP